ncbi:FAD/NAD(P)-binding domain-containing protein [Clathrospora elynae]|uniref:FAD/NAD(P)-binding domain-containing protein n=1 Tax=Clathrospora elynae TaxID=706981 RepID=A0A6A5T1E5_9PLEO|nr:FAD/NAD(P)-binding domain-containing protein [Clathrospora elynae]
MAPKIAIIGAGPGGCLLSCLLQTHNIPTTIFEAEASVNYRSQGGTLDLRTSTGLAAIKRAGLWDEFQKFARYDGEAFLLTDKNLTTWLRRGGRANAEGSKGSAKIGEAPEIDRAELRRLLMNGLPEGTVRWDYKLSRIEESPSGLSLHFANGQILDGFDLVVGCDGAFSKTRTVLSSERPYYTGLGGWTMNIPSASSTAPDVYKLVNRGSVFVYSDFKTVCIQQLGDESLYVSYYGPNPEDYTKTCGFDAQNDIEAAKAVMLKELSGWHPGILAAIEKSTYGLVWRNLYQLPVGFTWPHRAGVTLLGDAAHVMTPFAGVGVNTACWDAMLLADQIIEYTSSSSSAHSSNTNQVEALDPYIRQYEKNMYTHAHAEQELTEGSKIDMLFTAGAPRTTVARWAVRLAKGAFPVWSRWLLTVVVHVGFWVYGWFV